MEKLKLSAKQAEILANIQTKKAELSNAAQILTNQESIVAELAFEAAGVNPNTVTNIRLEGDCITYEVVAPKSNKADKKKEKPLEVVK